MKRDRAFFTARKGKVIKNGAKFRRNDEYVNG